MRVHVPLVFAALLLAACGADPVPPPPTTEATAALHKKLVMNSNYDADQIALSITSNQVVVAVTDSNLLAAAHEYRDADAARIAHVVESHVESQPGLRGVQAIHVDYFERPPGGAPRMKDSMDFRRDPQGRFRRDVS